MALLDKNGRALPKPRRIIVVQPRDQQPVEHDNDTRAVVLIGLVLVGLALLAGYVHG